MKNIKTIYSELLSQRVVKLVVFVVFLIVLSWTAYGFSIWVTSDFNPDALKIDSCLDRGGAWDYDLRGCHIE